ncbi:hypothetical protein QOZ80_5AG0387410 [Eleusine coracana subsp. coracana]|nr:hypothetical protein QOZ80_5AG0387410 [Eleusine coracana subsp. coracana]
MARVYHLALLVSLLVRAPGLTPATAFEESVNAPGGKKVTISMRYAAGEPGRRVGISVRYVDEDGGNEDKFCMDTYDDEMLGMAVKYLLSTLESLREHEKASRTEL